MAENVTDHGAVGDGSTDDTDAIRAAATAAGPGGTVYYPSGTYLVGSNRRYPLDYPMDGSWDNLTWRGEDQSSTTLLMASGQSSWHMMFRAQSGGGTRMADARFEHLTMDMNGSQQPDAPGSTWFRVYDGDGTFTMRDCVVTDTINAGIQLGDAMAGDFKYCQFSGCGDPNRSAGHALNLNQSASLTTTVSRCLIENSAGTDIDVGDDTAGDYQTVIIERCYISAGRGALKLDPGNVKTTIRNTRMVGGSRTTRMIKSNNDNYNCGSLELEDVLIDGAGGPGIDLGGDGHDTLTLNRVAVDNVERDGMRTFGDRTGIGVYAEGADLGTSGLISVTNVGSNDDGDALFFTDEESGSIEEVRHGGTGTLGTTGAVTIGSNALDGSALSPDTVSESEVGPRENTDDTNDSTTDTNDTNDSTTNTDYGGYNQPSAGTVDWHKPLNENFEKLEADVLSLAERIEQLE